MSQKDLDRIADKVLAYRPPEAEPTEPPPPLKIIAGAPDSPLVIGGIEIPCYVLEDETRVLSQRGVSVALGLNPNAGFRMPHLMATKAIKPYVTKDLGPALNRPIVFANPSGGGTALGYPAETLVEVCKSVLAARDGRVLSARHQRIAKQCDILIQGLATVGIIGLVDEATGYQRIREERALATILERYIAKELQPWTKTFPFEFYEEICRLRGWPDANAIRRPSIVGNYTNDLVYDRLAPGVLDELRRKNPVNPATGNRRAKHHQWFTPELGHPKLAQHIHAVTAIMRISSSWDMAKRNIHKAFPKPGETKPMELPESGD